MPNIKAQTIESSFSQFDAIFSLADTSRRIKAACAEIASFYGFEPIALSAIDDSKIVTPLAKAGMLGEWSPVQARAANGMEFMLSPSGFVSALRAYRSHDMAGLAHPIKLFFQEKSFFFEGVRSPEILRSREEEGLLIVGESGPVAEAQIIQVIWQTLNLFGLGPKRINIIVSVLGCSQCFGAFRSSFSAFLRSRITGLCKRCKAGAKTGPMRILTCEEEKCSIIAAHAPQILDFLCENCKKHVRGFLEFLDEMNLPYILEPKRIRNGSLYNTHLFEFALSLPEKKEPLRRNPTETEKTRDEFPSSQIEKESGEQSDHEKIRAVSLSQGRVTIGEGGRLSRMGELLTGRRLDAAGGVIMINKVCEVLLSRHGGASQAAPQPKVFLAQLGELARRRSLHIFEMLRMAGIPAMDSLGRDAIKSQLKIAEHVGAELALIVGQKEAIDGTAIVREVQSGIQETVPQEKLIEFLRKKLKR